MAADDVLKLSGIIEKVSSDIYTIEFDYLKMNAVMKLIKEEGVTILQQVADNLCAFEISIRKGSVNQTISRLNGLSDIKIVYRFSN